MMCIFWCGMSSTQFDMNNSYQVLLRKVGWRVPPSPQEGGWAVEEEVALQ